MKNLKVLAIVVLLAVGSALSASAQFSWGPKVGFTTSKLHLNKDALDSKNQTGFTGGLMAEIMLPVFNLGVDGSVMYVHRAAKFEDETLNRDYIEIPINLKWKIGIPAIGNIVTPYIFTGPSFAFLCSKKDYKNFVENKSCDITWNFGLGVQLLNKVQVSASYGLGLNKAIETKAFDIEGTKTPIYSGKDRYWTVTAAYLF